MNRCPRLLKMETGFSILEMGFALIVVGMFSSMMYRWLRVPAQMSLAISSTVSHEVPVHALDIVVNDLKQADAASFPASTITVDGRLGFFRRDNFGSDHPYTYIQYEWAPLAGGLGMLVRYANDTGPSQVGAMTTMVIDHIIQPSAGRPLFQMDPVNPDTIFVSIAYQPAGMSSYGVQNSSFTAIRRVNIRS